MILVFCPNGIDLYGIAHVKVEYFRLQEIYVMFRLGRFVWTTTFEQCGGGRRALNPHQATLRALVSFNLSNNNKKDFFWLMCFIFVYNTPAIQLLIKSTDKYENNNEYSKVSQ